MLKKTKRINILLCTISCLFFLSFTSKVFCYWEWRPESGKWINPKYYVGETSSEQWEIAMDFYNAEDYEAAIREFNKLLEHFPGSEETSEAQFMIGDCYEKLGAPYKACQSYQEVIENYPSTNRFKEIAQRQKKIADYFYTRQAADESITDKARELFTMSKCEKAAEIYRMVIKNYPYYENADEAQYRIGDCYKQMKKYETARAEFDKLSSQYPDSSLIDDAEYQKAVCWAKESERFPNSEYIFERAIKSFEDFIARYPENEFSDDAKEELNKLEEKKSKRIYDIAQFYEKNQEINAAKIYYKQVIEQFPDSIWADASESNLNKILQNENTN